MNTQKSAVPSNETVNLPQDPWAYVYAAATFGLLGAALLAFVVPMFF